MRTCGSDFHRKHYDHTDVTGPFDDTEFPQRKIYLDIIPKIAGELCPNVQYWANSPWGGPENANDLTIGDVHQWDGKLNTCTIQSSDFCSMAWKVTLLSRL
jgi:beta-mannosidase